MPTSLTDAERRGFDASVSRVEAAMSRVLFRANGMVDAMAGVDPLHRGLDRVVEAALARGVPLACREGCSACCHARVEVSAAEASRIAEAVRLQGDAAIERLRDRLQERAQDRPAHPIAPRTPPSAAARTPAGRAVSGGAGPRIPAGSPTLSPGSRAPCVLLVDGRCSVYVARPAVCRKAHSLDVTACNAGSATIPQDLALLLDAESLIQGVAAACRSAGLAGGALELSAALTALLDAAPDDPSSGPPQRASGASTSR